MINKKKYSIVDKWESLNKKSFKENKPKNNYKKINSIIEPIIKKINNENHLIRNNGETWIGVRIIENQNCLSYLENNF